MTHLIFDDSRARLPPSKGGLGYKGGWTTLEGLHKTAEEHYKREDPSSRSGVAGISFKFGFGFRGSGKDKNKNRNKNNSDGKGSSFGAGSGFGQSYGSGLIRAERGVGEIGEKVKRGTGIDPVKVLAHNAGVAINGNGFVNGEKEKED
ncbi:hypothetical protein K435DRAFT_378558 [Dendrothele bispora CBS 962.96]|uniref:Uncharacterized protein n=1 Tax=Dendrothele bispora (strain CBS 962.96) TaxID=1314807 RepID=A0A4S8LAL4_DENBC|nr:hypothetical protein K435DRAFT_378558 [Dendrothele bispora CBS 962.96]